MSTKKAKPIFYVLIKDVKTRPKYKTRMVTVYKNGVPTNLNSFAIWLAEAIDEKVRK